MNADTNWEREYNGKRTTMLSRGFAEVSPFEFYRDLFPVGSLQQENGDGSGKGNVIVTQIRFGSNARSPQWIVGDDLRNIEKAVGDPFGLIAPVSYFGRSHKRENAHELFAFGIDIDYVEVKHLRNLLKQFERGVQLSPTYLVSSGKGVHLYYFLKEPLPMYPEREKAYSSLKKAFIRRLWNDTSSQNPTEEADIAGVTQGFRAVGSQSKLGPDYPVLAFRVSGNRYTLQDIKDSIPGCTVKIDFETTMPLNIARLRYPEWYERKIQNRETRKERGHYVQDRRLYEWWKRKMREEVRSGGRYYSIMALCSFGLKCGVSDKEIKKDAKSFLEYFESITEDENNHFTLQDINDALKALRKGNRDLTLHATRKWIEESAKVNLTPQIRRNGRKQADHLELARAARDINQRRNGTKWNGRKSKAAAVQAWRAENPDGTKAQCIRETGISKMTVYKHWEQPLPLPIAQPDAGFSTIEDLNRYLDTLQPAEIREFYETHREQIDRFISESENRNKKS